MSAVLKKIDELPEGWSIASIDDVATISTGKRDANHATEYGEYKFFTCAFEPLAAPTYAFDDEALLLPGNGHNVGEVFYYKGKFEAYQRTYVLHEIKIEPKYLFYHLKLGWRKATSEKQYGSATNYIRIGNFTDYILAVAPPEQQKRIVAKIEELFSHIDAGIEALKKAKQLLKQYRQSVLKAAVTGELTKEWREANKAKLEPASQLLEKIEDARNAWIEEQIEKGSNEARRLKNKLKKHEFEELDASLIPEGWESVSLTKLCLLVVDCHNKTAPYVDSGIPLIRTSNIRDGVINFEEKMKYVNQETYEFWSRRCPPEPSDILFTREAPMGESAIIPDNKKVCMGQRMMLLRVIHDLVDVNYLHIALMDPLFLKRIQGFKVGVGVQHLRVGDVEKAVVALPSLTEQKEIVRVANERLDSTTRLENEIDHQLVKAEKNKQSVLSHSFSGKIIE